MPIMLHRTTWILALTLAVAANAPAQLIPDQALIQGYFHRNDTTYFVFDAVSYEAEEVERVVVTGSFRNWDQDMDSRAWRLGPRAFDRRVWMLPVYNPAYRVVGPGTLFKFRMNNGAWLEPLAEASNREAGNLVFMYGVEPLRLRAEVRGPRRWLWRPTHRPN